MSRLKLSSNKGFTIIELLIATAVFSVVLLLCAIAMLQIGRSYYQGVTAIKAQEAARAITDNISRDIQFEGGSVTGPSATPSQTYCVGSYRYSFVLNKQRKVDSPAVNQSRHVLIKEKLAGCVIGPGLNLAIDTANTEELVPEGMRLVKLAVTPVPPASSKLYKVTVKVVSGEDEVLDFPGDPDKIACKTIRDGAQFCAVSELSTIVQKRVN
jgi:prepilin-type N-terminal cleavage/methylation domain-containing protein